MADDELLGVEPRIEADGSVTTVIRRRGKPDLLIQKGDLVNFTDEVLADGRIRQRVEVVGPDGVDVGSFVTGS